MSKIKKQISHLPVFEDNHYSKPIRPVEVAEIVKDNSDGTHYDITQLFFVAGIYKGEDEVNYLIYATQRNGITKRMINPHLYGIDEIYKYEALLTL